MDIPSHPVSRLGEYIVIRDIAEGTFGKVKRELVISYVPAKHLLIHQSASMS